MVAGGAKIYCVDADFGETIVLESLDDLDDSLRDAAANPSGLLRLTAPLTFGTIQLMPALNDFARIHPAVTLQVDFTDDIVSLAQQGVDLAIRAGQPRDSTLMGRKLAVMRIQVVAAPAYLRRTARRNGPRICAAMPSSPT